MKIKTKKQLNLPQLIEWGFENDVTGTMFSDDRVEAKRIRFEVGILVSIHGDIHKGDTFTVEVEEEITEDTEIPKLMTTFKKTCLEGGIGYQRVRIDENYPIKLMLNKAEAHGEPVETLHVVNDDGTHTLIWRDGKLVE
ncbi:hypothetical protein ACWEWU_14365 [Staphylococcus xylosus]|uniref:hypothetical protein n=1 Tax=Staphylococcus xylosus TaxID=1288 RepID=UPI0021753D9B|nr:hypothetical protein [Staphylococcus xylosus]